MPTHTSETIDERTEWLALIMHAADDRILDLKTSHVYFSPRWKALLGYADDEIGNTFDDCRRLVHPDDAKRTLAPNQNYLQGKISSCKSEHPLKHKDGSRKKSCL